MSYSSFTLESVRTEFQLEIAMPTNLFCDIDPVTPSAHLTTELAISQISGVETPY